MQDVAGGHAKLGEPVRRNLREFDVVLLRQDPPFDLAYITSTHFLERLAPHTLVVNDPAAVRNAPEKIMVMEFVELMPPTLISRDRAEIEAFRARFEAVVMKPLYGHGGAAVFRLTRKDANFGSLYDLFATTFREPWVIQEFLPAVEKGDKRIILVDGQALGAVNRVPQVDDIRSNMVRGGRAEVSDLTPGERAICERIGPELKRRGLTFVGIDVIGDRITEINVTSPTGLARHQAARRPRSRGGDLGRDRGAPGGLALSAVTTRSRRQARSAPPVAAASEGERLRDAIAEASREAGVDNGGFRQSAARLLGAFLAERSRAARARLEAGGRGMACGEELSRNQDLAVRALHETLVARVGGAKLPAHALVAVGGYGRGALAPHSDIDLLFLAEDPRNPKIKLIVETLLYVLWDLKQKVGHATRSVDDCIALARSDMTIRTSILEARLLSGDVKLFETLRRRFDTQIVAKTAGEFVAAKLAERDKRIQRQGESRYLVEPNVKEGKGGLRDLNTLFWISKYVYRVQDPAELVGAGLFTAEELRLFRRCEEFLWAVRCHLHFLTDRAEERLSFDLQPPIAKLLGYASRAGQTDVERFMKHYFLVAKDVGDLTAIVCAALEEKQTKRAATFDRFLEKLRRRPQAVAEAPDFRIDVERVNVVAPDVFEKDPVNLIRLYWVADRSGLMVHPEAMRLVTKSLQRITAAVRNDPTANRLFLEILTSRRSPEVALRRMNEAGVLGRFIPEFGRVVGMMQYSMYHHFTVDEHLIRTVGVLNQIESGRLTEDHPLLSEILPHISHRASLYVAAFLHDIAKGRGVDHSIAGAEVARKLCPRFGLSAAETERIAWLVEQHLVMSNTAQGRDLSDPRTAETFGAIVQTMDRLRLLLALTVCDIRAVGPGVWNAWKGQLLRNLFWETEVVLGGGHSAIDRKSRVAAAREALRKALPNWSDPEFEAYASRHYPAYWLKVDLARQTEHAQLFHSMPAQVRSLTTEISTDAKRGVTELTVIAPDHPRLLSVIAGACASAAANIVEAHIFTTTDGFALDSIFISREFAQDADEIRRGRRIAETVEKSLRGEVRLRDIVQDRRKREARAKTFAVEPEVEIDNSLSGLYTVLQISALDRLGLLYDVTTLLSRLNLNIGSAHIVTFGEKAVDAFYVTDLTRLEDHRAGAAGGAEAAIAGDAAERIAAASRRLIFAG